MAKVAFAVAAHPDDIEFQMAGTLILLKQAGYQIHYMNVANGCYGTAVHSKEEIIRIRREEAKVAANNIGAIFHDSLADDFSVFYEPVLLARMAAIFREVNPEIVLLQSPSDYMEDHQNTVRLVVSAAFTRGMQNFETNPPRDPVDQQLAIYHAQPHGNRDPLGQFIQPHLCIDISSVIEQKTDMLACHKSQKEWLDKSQGMGAYLHTMQELGREMGELTGSYTYAEGWRKRLHLGFARASFAPLESVLSSYTYFFAD